MTIVNLNPDEIAWQTLLHETLEREGVEAVVLIVRTDDRWHTAWSTLSNASVCMASMKLQDDVLEWIRNGKEK